MNISDIQTRINAISDMMVAKGLRIPGAQFDIKSHAEPQVYLHWEDKSRIGGGYEFIGGKTPQKSLEKAEAFVAALPDREQAKFREFMTALGGVIDLGKDNGIEVEFLNPLLATMKKLSENALTYQPETA